MTGLNEIRLDMNDDWNFGEIVSDENHDDENRLPTPMCTPVRQIQNERTPHIIPPPSCTPGPVRQMQNERTPHEMSRLPSRTPLRQMQNERTPRISPPLTSSVRGKYKTKLYHVSKVMPHILVLVYLRIGIVA